MTKPVTLSDTAFIALRKEKKQNESTSQTIMRLIDIKHERARNPANFLRINLERAMSADEHRSLIQESRKDDKRDPWNR